jgi:hypothetical protein
MAKTMRAAVGVMLAALAFTPGLLGAPAAQATHDAAPARPATTASYGNHIINMYSWKCLVARDASPGTGAVQYDCGSYADQNWVLVQRTEYQWEIKNAFTGLCLAVQSENLEQQVVDAPCYTEGDTRTDWGVEDRVDYAVIYSKVNLGCLLVRGTANEAPVVTTACNPERFADQRWYLPG